MLIDIDGLWVDPQYVVAVWPTADETVSVMLYTDEQLTIFPRSDESISAAVARIATLVNDASRMEMLAGFNGVT